MYLMQPMRQGIEKKKSLCVAISLCFHPDGETRSEIQKKEKQKEKKKEKKSKRKKKRLAESLSWQSVRFFGLSFGICFLVFFRFFFSVGEVGRGAMSWQKFQIEVVGVQCMIWAAGISWVRCDDAGYQKSGRYLLVSVFRNVW